MPVPDDVDVTIGNDTPSDSDPGLTTTPDTGRTSDGEGEGNGELDLEQVAEEFDAEALAKLGTSRPRSDRSAKGEGEDGGGIVDPVDAFIEKNYGGDRNAFVHSQYSSREEMKRMRQELDELKQGTTTTPERQAPEPRDLKAAYTEARSSDPELQALDQEITVIDNDVKLSVQDITRLTGRATQIAGAIKEAEGRLSKSEPEERALIRAEIAELRGEVFSLNAEYEARQSEVRRLHMEKRRVQREVLRAEQNVRSSLADEEDEAAERAQTIATTNQQFNSSIASHFATTGIDPKSEQGTFLRETCRTQLRDYLQSQGDGSGLDGPQLHAAVGRIIARAVKVFGLKPSARPASKTPLTPRPIVTPRPPIVTSGGRRSSSPQSSLEGVLNNPNLSPREKAAFVDKRAEAVFAASARAAASRGPS